MTQHMDFYSHFSECLSSGLSERHWFSDQSATYLPVNFPITSLREDNRSDRVNNNFFKVSGVAS